MRISDWSSDVCSSDLKRGTARIWLEGRRLERAGFVPAARYEISLDETTRTITLSLAANGERMVSRKVRGDTELPVIDIANGKLLERDRKSTRLNSSH